MATILIETDLDVVSKQRQLIWKLFYIFMYS